MKKKCNRLFAVLLVIMICLNALPTAASAINVYTDEVSYINPLYADVLSESDLNSPSDGIALTAIAGYSTTVSEAAEEVRTQLEARNETITLLYAADSYDSSLAKSIFSAALEHTGVSTQGDYLKWQYGGWKASISYYTSGGTCYMTFKYTVTYYTTADQEEELTAALEEVMDSLDLDDKSDYEKVCAIYDYLCTHVTYDYDNLYDDDYMLKYTAYAALINGTSVCQGYSVLFYRMALEAGLDARLISGTGNGGAHAWNIVQLGSYYYNLDATWDTAYYSVLNSYTYFLRCDSNFGDHTRDADYASDEFYELYPMADADYYVHVHTYDDGTVTAPTCTEGGYTTYTCTICGEEYTGNETEALGHSYDDGAVIAATCTENGSVTYTCKECGESYTETIAAPGHTSGEAVIENETAAA